MSCCIEEIRSWKNPTYTGAVLAVSTVVYFLMITTVYPALLMAVRALQLVALACIVLRSFKNSMVIKIDISAKKEQITECAISTARCAADHISRFLQLVTADPATGGIASALKIIFVSQLVWLAIKWVGVVTIAYISFVAWVSWPQIYQYKKREIDGLVKTLQDQVNEILRKIGDAIPPAAKSQLASFGVHFPAAPVTAAKNK